jgi:mediator of RNA polymerase II transcription subunit 5
MLSSVLNIIAKPLEHALRAYQKQDPKSQEIEPLLKELKESLPVSRRTAGADHNELESWTSTANGGLTAAVKHTIQSFVQWSLHPGINIMPTSYTHRQILVALKILGAKRCLYIISDEIKQQTEAGAGSVVYDIATALICAPDVTNDPQPIAVALLDGSGNVAPPLQRRLNLREALKFEAEDCKKIQKSDPGLAETIVRLYRKVEEQMVISQAQAILESGLSLDLQAGAAELDDAMVASAAVAGGVAGPDAMTLDTTGLDLGLGSVSGDMGLGGSTGSAGGTLDLGADADLFGSLSGDADLLSWGMDLS